MERAIGNQTAMIYFLIADKHFGQYRDQLDAPGGKVSLEECIRISKAARVPILVDAAAEVPPFDNLSAYVKMGVDLVAFSGGKALRGPQNAGLLLGRKDLIDVAKLNTSPNCGTIGRGMKVSKEDMVAMWAAVERFMRVDLEAEDREWRRRIEVIAAAVRGIPTLKAETIVPPIANHVPH